MAEVVLSPEEGQRLTSALSQIQDAVTPVSADALPSKEELCKVYHKVRPIIEVALPWLRRIPLYGSGIAAAVEFLVKVADLLCGPA